MIESGYGTVSFQDGFFDGSSQWYTAVAGFVTVLTRKETGIPDTKGSESWVAKVAVPDDPDNFVVVPGCQIRAIEFGCDPPVGPNCRVMR